jgi:hypothetical protein
LPVEAALPSCSVKLTGGFGNLWRTNQKVRETLGCPIDGEQAGRSVEQLFERGRMYWRQDGNHHWVFSGETSGVYRDYQNVPDTDPDPSDTPPENRYMPAGGFGKLWEKHSEIRESVGWATTPQQAFDTGVMQVFQGGTMLFVPGLHDHGKLIYVLDNSSRWTLYRDTYVGP